MKTSIPFVVAALVAVAGCQSKDESAKADRHAAQPQAAQQTTKPGTADDGTVVGSAPAARPQGGQQSGSLGSGDATAPAGASKPVLDGTSSPTSSDNEALNHIPPIDGDAGAAGDASKSSSATSSDIGAPTTPAPGASDKSSGQRGQVLTNEGAVKPPAVSGSSSGVDPSMNDAASSEAVNSLHIDHADSAVSRPPLGDQATLGSSESDRMLVQRIRQAVIDDETLSPQSRSVQIQSVDGQIVLKGQVGSERERQRLGDTAFRESGGKMVINQLEVVSRSP